MNEVPPDLKRAGGRIKWCRVRGDISQAELARVLEYRGQSGVSNLESRDSLNSRVAVLLSRYFTDKLGLLVTPEWLYSGGPLPQKAPPTPSEFDLGGALKHMGKLLRQQNSDVRQSIGRLLEAWAQDPVSKEGNIRAVTVILASNGRPPVQSPDGFPATASISRRRPSRAKVR